MDQTLFVAGFDAHIDMAQTALDQSPHVGLVDFVGAAAEFEGNLVREPFPDDTVHNGFTHCKAFSHRQEVVVLKEEDRDPARVVQVLHLGDNGFRFRRRRSLPPCAS